MGIPTASRTIASGLLVAAVCLCVAGPVRSTEARALLDGKSFVGLNGEKGRELDPNEREEIVFEHGRFRSVSCDPYNFGSADYTARSVGEVIQFEAVTESPTHGRISWKGIVKGDTAEMEFVWTKERWFWDTRREYWFRGTLKR